VIAAVAAGEVVITTALTGLAEAVERRGSVPELTERQVQVLRGRARGEPFKTIASRLDISRKTAEEHMAAVTLRFSTYLRTHSPGDLERHLGSVTATWPSGCDRLTSGGSARSRHRRSVPIDLPSPGSHTDGWCGNGVAPGKCGQGAGPGPSPTWASTTRCSAAPSRTGSPTRTACCDFPLASGSHDRSRRSPNTTATSRPSSSPDAMPTHSSTGSPCGTSHGPGRQPLPQRRLIRQMAGSARGGCGRIARALASEPRRAPSSGIRTSTRGRILFGRRSAPAGSARACSRLAITIRQPGPAGLAAAT